MKSWIVCVLMICVFCSLGQAEEEIRKFRIFVVDSYHSEYLWSQNTNEGVSSGLLERSFLDSKEDVLTFTRDFYVESSRAVIKKIWMDTKNKNSRSEKAEATANAIKDIEEFQPDILLLGDDNAANYIGNHYMDTEMPIVFWGVNGKPGKYGLVESLEKPGHNVTGIYQAGYWIENLQYLKKMVPEMKSIALLSDDSPTGRSKLKEIVRVIQEGLIDLEIVDSIFTNSYEEWQSRALKANQTADAFVVLNHNTLKDNDDNPVEYLKAGAWYLENIRKPECSGEKFFVTEGMLLSVDDSGYKQGYEAVEYAYEILINGIDPGILPIKAPERGAIVVNRQRAKVLGISLDDKDFIEDYIDESLALQTVER